MRSLVVVALVVPFASHAADPRPTTATPTPVGSISSDVAAVVAHFNEAVRIAPAAVNAQVEAFRRHGVASFLMDHQAVQAPAQQVGYQAGRALFFLGQAIRKDMLRSIQESQIAAPVAGALR